MKYNIFIEGNYFIIKNDKGEFYYGLRKEVFVDKNNIDKNIYRFFNVKDFSSNTIIKLEDILKEDNSPYSLSEWKTFYTENTGNFNSGAVIAPQILDALNNSNSPSGLNPFATLSDVGVKSIDSVVVNLDGTMTINFTDGNNISDSVTTNKSVLDIKYNVLNYSDLSTILDQELYDFAYVRQSQGTQWLPGSLGGTYYGAGLYMWNGTIWVEDKTNIYQELDNILTNKADVNHTHIITDVVELRTELDSLSSTTLLTLDGTVQINSDNTKFNFPGGSGVIVDNSVFPPTRAVVTWSALVAETTPFLNTSTNTFLAVDINGNLVKTQDLQAVHDTPDYIIVGWVEHTNGFIERVGTEPYYNLNIGQQFQQLLETLGAFNVEGNEVSANGVNLKLDISAGVVVDNGLGFNQNIKSPNHYVSNTINQVQFRYFYRDGSGDWVNNLPLVSDVNVNNYDDGSGTLQTIPSGKWLLQRVFYYAPFGYLDIYHSQDYYNSAEEALDAYSRGGFEDNEYISYDIPVAIIVVKHATTDLSNNSDCIIRKVSSSKVGGSNVSSGESNTASNIGVSGVGLFKQKIGVDLEFKKINAGSNKITIIDDVANNEVDINVNEANFTNIPQSAITNLTSDLTNKVNSNTLITGATKTKISYDSKGLVTAGVDATTADIADSNNRRYVTDAQLVIIGNTSGINTGDNAANTNYADDYRASNFVAGVDYALPNSNTTGTSSNITDSSNTTLTSLPNLIVSQSQVTNLTTDLITNSTNDRNRANHTGTQTASTISDFNTAVSSTALLKLNNLSDVANITTARNNILPSKTGNANKVLRVNAGETDYELVTISAGGSTNLSTAQTPTDVTINSDTGTDASISLADGVNAGVSLNNFTTAEKNKLSGLNNLIELGGSYTTTSTTRGNIPEFTFNMVNGGVYEILLYLNYQTVATTTGVSIGFVTPSGTANITGTITFTVAQTTSNTELHQPIRSINSVNTTAGSFATSTGVGVINSPHTGYFSGILKCTSSGTFQVQLGSEVTGSQVQLNQISTMKVTKLN